MAATLPTAAHGIKAITLFEIRLDQQYVIFMGNRDEAADFLITGNVVLCLSDPLRLQCVKLRFTGENRVCFYQLEFPMHNKQKRIVVEFDWDLFTPPRNMKEKFKGGILEAGNHEWRFEYKALGSSPESLEGLDDSWLKYRLKATVGRGPFQQSAYVEKTVRFIRTLNASSLLLAGDASLRATWAERLEYWITTPTRAVIFGTLIRIDFAFFPLLRGVTVEDIVCSLVQEVEIVVKSRTNKTSRNVVQRRWKPPEEVEDIDGREGFRLRKFLPIPRSLNQCLQTANVPGIRSKHYLGFRIRVVDPTEDTKELHFKLYVHVFISPNIPIDDNNYLIRPLLQRQTSQTLNELSPPNYGQHHFDPYYSEVDPCGYMTPPAGSVAGSESGANSPFSAHTGTASGSVNSFSYVNPGPSDALAPNVLHNRLRDLENVSANRWDLDRSYNPDSSDEGPQFNASNCTGEQESSFRPLHSSLPVAGSSGSAGENTSPLDPGSSSDKSELRESSFRPLHQSFPAFASSSSAGGSQTQSTPVETSTHSLGSESEEGLAPMQNEYGATDLTKVPSYNTASHARPTAPINFGLPNYDNAINTREPSHPTPHPPRRAHVRGPSEGRRFLQARHVDLAADAIGNERRARILRTQDRQ